jgi:peptidoglycan hydrolase-like protein with peptidoglycan-binding domain
MSQTTERTPSGDGEVTGPVRPESSPVARREPDGAAAARPKGSRRRRRTRIVAAIAVVVVAGAAGAVSWATGLFDSDSGSTTATAASRLSAAKVERGDLVETQDVDGTLGYGDAWGISSAAQGTVTWLPAEGSRITRGETLYEVDEKPVTLMYGAIPLYRALGQGDEGGDVKELEQNLAALGYTGFDIDDNYTSATTAAVQDWQADRGLDQTGRVDSSQIVFSAGALRVASQKVRVGDRAAQGPLITVTPTSQVVTVDLDVADRDLAKKGRAVTIDLPGGKTVKGHITSVGTVAESSSSDQNSGDQSPSDSATIEVIVTIDKGQSAAGLDQAPVTVTMESSRTKDVLSVPVAALLAISDDAYAVQVIQPDATTKMVPVDIGTFADGRVEVEGGGITEGTVVGVPET